ncbi:LemA family protein [Eubacteriales bacterium OttesenSCG-928-G02]|nr:LemA family protein [Eubacteriales bacterium OttesenSCG-928-G02]
MISNNPAIFILIAVLAVLAIIAIWFISTRNKIKRAEIKIDEAASGIDVALTKRFDCLTKLLSVVKAYAAHEKETFSEIVNLRKGSSISEKNEASKQLNTAFEKINIIAENYPELKSNENFKQLQHSIMDTEEHLQAARRLYNSNVTIYNNIIVSFPQSLVASSMSCEKKDFFSADEIKRDDVKMDF